jgi:hypothetical protein
MFHPVFYDAVGSTEYTALDGSTEEWDTGNDLKVGNFEINEAIFGICLGDWEKPQKHLSGQPMSRQVTNQPSPECVIYNRLQENFQTASMLTINFILCT